MRAAARAKRTGKQPLPNRVEAQLSYYEVNDYGTLTDPTLAEPKFRFDVFDGVSTDCTSISRLIDEIASCSPLQHYFERLANEHLALIRVLLNESAGAFDLLQRRRLKGLAHAMDRDDECGWREWIKYEGDPGLAGFCDQIQSWLDADINWDESEWFDSGWNGQQVCLAVFQDMDQQILDALGIVIIEGDCPCSSYYAAELRRDIDEANQVAELLRLEFRFRPEVGGKAA